MNPWQNVWAPNVHFPLSGSVAQRIEPTANWFFDAIDANAGNARVEKRVFAKASYGRQISWLTDVVLGLAEDGAKLDDKASSSLAKLKELRQVKETIKAEDAAATAAEIEQNLEWLKQSNQDEFEKLARKLRAILQGT
ncbi:hypothetical protein [Aquabacterium sp.]|uniref:hypothetical protein n=1 Tax=Aquabacterium sp. TaxID=1872578 RepID=UPI0025C3EC7E|nr:hypothetical protein [Aquabacterium sp.]